MDSCYKLTGQDVEHGTRKYTCMDSYFLNCQGRTWNREVYLYGFLFVELTGQDVKQGRMEESKICKEVLFGQTYLVHKPKIFFLHLRKRKLQ